jgi:peptide/nickel transport system ATP-binding protein
VTVLSEARAPSSGGVRVSGLTVATRLRKTPIVEGISFSLQPGTVLGVVGESGSGKSTMGVALLGLARRGLKIADGQVIVDGTDILQLPASELQKARGSMVSYVPQDPTSGLNPGLTVGWQLREMFTVHPEMLASGQSAQDRIMEVLSEVGLPTDGALLKRYPHQLSGGQQQRIGIAMAFMCRPRLIVLDEPTTGLDVTTQRRVLQTVRELTEEHDACSVYISHDLAVVSQVASQTTVMYGGRIVESGPTGDIFRSARHHYTAGLLHAAPSAKRSTVLVGIEGRPPRPGHWPGGCGFAPRCSAAQEDCRATVPPFTTSGPDHVVRCLHPVPPANAAQSRADVPPVPVREGAALSVRNLSAHYGATQVLHGVDLDVSAGRCTAIVGESGSGKTTLARCLAGLHTTWSGDARLGDSVLVPRPDRRSEHLRRVIQYVFQNPYSSLNPRMSVGQNMDEPLRHFTRDGRQARREKVKSVLNDVALGEDYIDRMLDQLSGGERQRVAVARALAVQPELLICDEITSALDVSVQALLVEELRQLQVGRGLSMLFITHNLAVVRSIAQDVVVLEKGHVVEHGAVQDVLDNPRHPYTRQLLADLPHIEAATQIETAL